MSSLNPKGVEVELNGEKRHLLFDYNIIAEIQEKYDSSVIGVIRSCFRTGEDVELNAKIFIGLLHILLEGERDRVSFLGTGDADLTPYTVRELGYLISRETGQTYIDAIMEAWGISLPVPTAEDQEELDAEKELAEAEGRDPNRRGGRRKAK